MKNFKVLITILLALALVFTITACGEEETKPCETHVDGDEDGLCDVCKKKLEAKNDDGITLIKDEEILFGIVLGSDIGTSTKMVLDAVQRTLEDFDIELPIAENGSKDEFDIEILVGTVTSRGEEYEYDKYSLGYEGYTVTALDETKILISAGSDATLSTTLADFFEKTLGISDDMDELSDFVFTEDCEVLKVQDNYRITGISIDGVDLKGYQIVRDRSITSFVESASKLQNFLYTKAGYWLETVTPDKAGEKTISFRAVEKGKAGANGFRVKLDGSNLVFECAHTNKFSEAFDVYYNKSLVSAKGDVELKAYDSELDITRIYYSEYGAVGDGKTDDFAAIRATHNAANAGGQTVCADAGKTYYIGKSKESPVPIRTNVDWGGAKFIFDASAFTKDDSRNVFVVQSDYADITISETDERIKALNEAKSDGLVIKGVNHGDAQTKKLDLGLGYPAMLTVYNSSARVYLRWGYVDAAGSDNEQFEVIHVDENGNIDPSTPFLLDYEKITSITVHRTDVEPITIKNATVNTLATRVNLLGKYESYTRGIVVSRPNTTIQNLYHEIIGEIASYAPVKVDENGLSYDVSDEGFTVEGGVIKKNGTAYTGDDVKLFTGPSFSGFIQAYNTHNVLVKGCTFQARVYYLEGTYDIACYSSNQILFEDCEQSNFFDQRDVCTQYGDSTSPNLAVCWGIAGTNFCKNLHYLNSSLNRYDAHAGVFNGSVKGGKLGVLRLIGGGTFTLEGVEVYRMGETPPFQLREDFGASFNGTVILKDVMIKDGQYSTTGKYGSSGPLFDAPTAPFNNGYVSCFPNIIIDNLKIETTDTEIELVSLGGEVYSASNHFPARSINKGYVHDPDALITIYYETKNANIVEDQPELFPYLDGFKKTTKAPASLKNREYTVVNNGNSTYTVIAKGVKNINPYMPPEFIEIKNMDNFENSNGKQMKLTLYSSNFFAETKIIEDGTELTKDGTMIKRVSVPK